MQNRLIIVPTFNELANAPIIIERIFKHIANSHILIIDDGSLTILNPSYEIRV